MDRFVPDDHDETSRSEYRLPCRQPEMSWTLQGPTGPLSIVLDLGVYHPVSGEQLLSLVELQFPLVKAIARGDGAGRLELGGITVLVTV